MVRTTPSRAAPRPVRRRTGPHCQRGEAGSTCSRGHRRPTRPRPDRGGDGTGSRATGGRDGDADEARRQRPTPKTTSTTAASAADATPAATATPLPRNSKQRPNTSTAPDDTPPQPSSTTARHKHASTRPPRRCIATRCARSSTTPSTTSVPCDDRSNRSTSGFAGLVATPSTHSNSLTLPHSSPPSAAGTNTPTSSKRSDKRYTTGSATPASTCRPRAGTAEPSNEPAPNSTCKHGHQRQLVPVAQRPSERSRARIDPKPVNGAKPGSQIASDERNRRGGSRSAEHSARIRQTDPTRVMKPVAASKDVERRSVPPTGEPPRPAVHRRCNARRHTARASAARDNAEYERSRQQAPELASYRTRRDLIRAT